MKRFFKGFLLVLIGGLMVTGCSKHQVYDIYNTWICTDRRGPILVINKEKDSFQYNKQANRKINYLSGKVEVKQGHEALKEIHEKEKNITTVDEHYFYSIKCYFNKYINDKGVDESSKITKNDVWWYAFQIVGNGRAQVMNMNTGEKFYMEVSENG